MHHLFMGKVENAPHDTTIYQNLSYSQDKYGKDNCSDNTFDSCLNKAGTSTRLFGNTKDVRELDIANTDSNQCCRDIAVNQGFNDVPSAKRCNHDNYQGNKHENATRIQGCFHLGSYANLATSAKQKEDDARDGCCRKRKRRSAAHNILHLCPLSICGHDSRVGNGSEIVAKGGTRKYGRPKQGRIGAQIDTGRIGERVVARYPEIRELVYDYIRRAGTLSEDSVRDSVLIGRWSFVPGDIAGPLLDKDMELVFGEE